MGSFLLHAVGVERRGRIWGMPSGAASDASVARVPPHDLDAERAVIGAMLVSEAAVSVVGESLAAEDFYSETHRVLYEIGRAHVRTPVTPISRMPSSA